MIQVHVTQEDIDNGEREDCETCPVALALARATGCSASVTNERLMIRLENRNVFHRSPLEVVKFVRNFDAGCKVKPFTFEVPELTEWSRRGRDVSERIDLDEAKEVP